MMMYPFSEFKTEAPTSWADPYGGIAAAGVSPEILQTTFNSSRTPDSTDSYAYPTHNGGNGYYPNQYPTNQHTPHYYQQQQQQQQQQQSYYSSEQYYQNNNNKPRLSNPSRCIILWPRLRYLIMRNSNSKS